MQSVESRRPIAAEQVDEALRAFAAVGAVHLTGAVAPEVLDPIRSAAERVLDKWDALAAVGRLPAEHAVPHERRFVQFSSLLPAGNQGALSFLHLGVLAVARYYLAKEPAVAPDSYVRSVRIERSDAHLPFHQDQTIRGCPLVNVWIPFGPCGLDAPGLEIVTESWSALLPPAPPHEPKFAVERAQLDTDEVMSRFGTAALWRPSFAPGDAMVFSGATIHRTYVSSEMTADRMSIEIRLL